MDLSQPYKPKAYYPDVYIQEIVLVSMWLWFTGLMVFALLHLLPAGVKGVPTALALLTLSFVCGSAWAFGSSWRWMARSVRFSRGEYAWLKDRGDLTEVQCRYLADRTHYQRLDFTVDTAGVVHIAEGPWLELVAPDGSSNTQQTRFMV